MVQFTYFLLGFVRGAMRCGEVNIFQSNPSSINATTHPIGILEYHIFGNTKTDFNPFWVGCVTRHENGAGCQVHKRSASRTICRILNSIIGSIHLFFDRVFWVGRCVAARSIFFVKTHHLLTPKHTLPAPVFGQDFQKFGIIGIDKLLLKISF
ncbi:MAG: hypothetical protein J7641_01820 [Cyanobacteria bacterium SID2]|nr:hypothetical protein [Cyanobacteria bacterium SID2]MBP0003086.1 hypothetical protein [Cyanobacteria bacterium SBC]